MPLTPKQAQNILDCRAAGKLMWSPDDYRDPNGRV